MSGAYGLKWNASHQLHGRCEPELYQFATEKYAMETLNTVFFFFFFLAP